MPLRCRRHSRHHQSVRSRHWKNHTRDSIPSQRFRLSGITYINIIPLSQNFSSTGNNILLWIYSYNQNRQHSILWKMWIFREHVFVFNVLLNLLFKQSFYCWNVEKPVNSLYSVVWQKTNYLVKFLYLCIYEYSHFILYV